PAISQIHPLSLHDALPILAHMAQQKIKPDFALIGEPTLMQVVTAHKGVLSFETVVHGHEAHSSQPQLGVNAVHIACELVHFLTTDRKSTRLNSSHVKISYA